MNISYGLAILDLNPSVITKPFLENIPKISKLFIIGSQKEKYFSSLNSIQNFLISINIDYEFINIDDITDFFEIYLTLEKICEKYGIPEWVNVSSNQGIGISAFAVHGYIKNTPLILYDKEKDTTIFTTIKKLKKIRIYKNKYFDIIEELKTGEKTIKDLSNKIGISKSAMSRRLKNMKILNIVKLRGSGRGKTPYKYSLTSFGKKL